MNQDILDKFKNTDLTGYPDFFNYEKVLDKALWILWIAKEELKIKALTSEDISNIIKEVKEIYIHPRNITNAFNRAKDKIHSNKEDNNVIYEIMKPGKEHLLSYSKEGKINLIYFRPEKRFTSKRLLSNNILNNLKGTLKFVDPYIGIRTLDILKDLKNKKINFLTKLNNLRENQKKRFLREYKDFKIEFSNIEIRDYPNKDIHDRYIITSDNFVLIGHSIKDLGAKESFAVVFSKLDNIDIYKILVENFQEKWNKSNSIS